MNNNRNCNTGSEYNDEPESYIIILAGPLEVLVGPSLPER